MEDEDPGKAVEMGVERMFPNPATKTNICECMLYKYDGVPARRLLGTDWKA